MSDAVSAMSHNGRGRPGTGSRAAIWALLLAAAAVVVYSDSLGGPFVADDFENIEGISTVRMDRLEVDQILRAARGRHPARPAANLSFAFNYYLHGYSVFGYHLVNLLIHAANGVLLFFLLRGTLTTEAAAADPAKARRQPSAPETAAGLAALLWVLHPVQTQAVTYVVQRMTALSAMFYLSAMLFYVAGRRAQGRGKKAGLFAACAGCGALALGSKETAVTLPAALFFYEWFFFQGLDRAWIRKKAALLVLAVVFVVAAGAVYTGRNPAQMLTDVLAGYKNRPFTPAERLMTQPRVLVFYLSLLAWPHPSRQNLYHDFAVSRSLADPATTVPAMLLVAAMLVLAAAGARKHRFAAFAVFWFFGNLLLESSIIPLEMVFEHRLYLPSMLLVAVPVAALLSSRGPGWRPVVAMLACAAVLGSLTYRRNTVWADEVTLYTDVVEKSPNQARPHYALAGALAERGRLAEAEAHLKRTLAIEPGHKQAQNSLGAVLARMGRAADAVAAFERVLEIDPRYAGAHYNLGRVYRSMGKTRAAARHFERAIELRPQSPEAMVQLAWIRAAAPDPALRSGEQALDLARRLIRFMGENQPLALDVLAAAYAESGRFEAAAETAAQARSLAEQFGLSRPAAQIGRREALYRAGRPFREEKQP